MTEASAIRPDMVADLRWSPAGACSMACFNFKVFYFITELVGRSSPRWQLIRQIDGCEVDEELFNALAEARAAAQADYASRILSALDPAIERMAALEAENARLREVIPGAIAEMRVMCTEAEKRDGELRHYYQGVDAARDTLEIYFRRALTQKDAAK